MGLLPRAQMCLGFFFGYGVPAANSLIAECCPTSFRPNLVCSAAIMSAAHRDVQGLVRLPSFYVYGLYTRRVAQGLLRVSLWAP